MTVKIWDCSTDKFIKNLPGLSGEVNLLHIYDGKLFTGSLNGEVQVFDCSDDHLITTLEGHNDHVSSFTINDGELFSASAEKTIKVWKV
jgi:WD40 repeat protein